MNEEKKVVKAYTVKHYEDGSVEATNADIEGIEQMTINDIRTDIQNVFFSLLKDEIRQSVFEGITAFYIKANQQQVQPEPVQQPEQQ